MAYVYKTLFYVMYVQNGQTQIYKSDAGEVLYWTTAELACNAVKGIFGNDYYKVVQELNILKTDVPETTP